MNEQICPVCKRKNDSSAVYCIFCGASLDPAQTKPSTTTRRVTPESNIVSDAMERNYVTSLAIPERGLALYLIDSVKPVAVREENQFVLGRRLTDIKTEAFLDLTPYGGYEYGVSHRHAMIRKIDNKYEILDLDSTNGTYLNNKRILPNIPYPMPHGSHIRLGKLILYIIYKEITVQA